MGSILNFLRLGGSKIPWGFLYNLHFESFLRPLMWLWQITLIYEPLKFQCRLKNVCLHWREIHQNQFFQRLEIWGFWVYIRFLKQLNQRIDLKCWFHLHGCNIYHLSRSFVDVIVWFWYWSCWIWNELMNEWMNGEKRRKTKMFFVPWFHHCKRRKWFHQMDSNPKSSLLLLVYWQWQENNGQMSFHFGLRISKTLFLWLGFWRQNSGFSFVLLISAFCFLLSPLFFPLLFSFHIWITLIYFILFKKSTLGGNSFLSSMKPTIFAKERIGSLFRKKTRSILFLLK